MKKLILKYLTNTISDKELSTLHNWLVDPKNQTIFKTYIKDDYNLNVLYDSVNLDDAFNKIREDAQNQTKVIPLYKRNVFKYVVAASIILLISLPFVFNTKKGSINEPTIVNTNIKSGTNKATLTLEDGTNIILDNAQNLKRDNLSSNGKEIIYKAINKETAEVAYNYLTVPRGGQYFVQLPDNTQVWLNSESKLKYPINFIEGKTREVELLYGEAYFDVSPSEQHKGSKFKVLTSVQEVEVIGTEFNIKAYKDESNIYTALVEGKISITDDNNAKEILEPSQQSVYNIENSELTVDANVNLYDIISWRRGIFSFKDKSLKEIMSVLSRWYDVDIIYENNEVKEILFGGIFNKDRNLEEILEILENTKAVKFQINEKRIVVK